MEIKAEFAVLLGALSGGAISVFTNWIQQRSQMNRDLIRIAFEMAVKEYDTLIEIAKEKDKPSTLYPLESFVTYYIEYLEVAKSKNSKVKKLKKLRKFREELNSIYKQTQIIKTNANKFYAIRLGFAFLFSWKIILASTKTSL